MKILFLCLGSYKVKDITGADGNNFDRQLLYAISLTRLCQVAPAGTKILVAENTAVSIKDLHPHLQTALRLPQITDVLFSQDNLGVKNKGAGEYGLCRFALENRRDLFEQAEWIVYYTHRHIMSFPLIFKYLEKYQNYEVIVSNAPFLYPDRKQNVPDAGVFHDLIFAMQKETFLKYLETMNPELMVRKHLGSEQNLYRFITDQKVKFRQVEHFGVFRYDYQANLMNVL